MKVGSFPDLLIPNTYNIHVYDVRSYGYSAVFYSTLISLTGFLAVKQYAYVTIKCSNNYFTNRIFIFIKNMYDSVIRQAENDLDAGLHVFGIRDIGLSL